MNLFCKCLSVSPEPLIPTRKEYEETLVNLDVTIYFKNKMEPFNILVKGNITSDLQSVSLWPNDLDYYDREKWKKTLGQEAFDRKYYVKKPFRRVLNPSNVIPQGYYSSYSGYNPPPDQIKFYPHKKEEVIIMRDTIAKVEIKTIEVEKIKCYYYLGK